MPYNRGGGTKTIFIIFFFFLIVILVPDGSSAILSKFTYSKAIDFTQGFALNQLAEEIKTDPGILEVFMGITMILDDITIIFDQSITLSEMDALNSIIAKHVPESLLDHFCVTLEDANIRITTKMMLVGILVAPTTLERDYTMLSAAQIIASGEYKGGFMLVNDGIGTVNLLMGIGGDSRGSMGVVPGSSGKFMYAITNDTHGSETYMIIRVS